MPHSSGGGSHSGGSHGGSHHRSSSRSHSGGSSGRPANRSSSSAFDGATRYMYYRHKKPVFVYANYDIRKSGKTAWVTRICILIFIVIPIIVMSGVILFMFGHFPKPIPLTYDSQIIIDDQVGLIQDQDRLMESLEKFQKKTGITPAVVTYSNDVWQDKYKDLETFAYKDYLSRFDDEKHWLIVYTITVREDGFDDWHWEGMQGDDTDPILDSKQTRRFTENLHKYFLTDKYSVDEAIAMAFDELTPHDMDKYLSQPGSMVLLIFDAFFLGLMLLCMDFHPIREHNYRKAEVVDSKFVDQEACEYCSGIYVVGYHTKCPHCGAPVKPHDFYTDADGNIINIVN